MTAVEWDEVKRLAADFQRAQLSSTIQRLSERNCVEVITKLIELKLLDVIFTTDGKEYVTPQQLTREIQDELYVHGGRINLVELAKILNVDLSQISARATEIEHSESGITLVLGQLIDKSYLNHIAEEINEKLSQQGQVTIGDLTRHYDLPSDFLQSVVEKQLGKIIVGKQDKTDPRVFFTESYVARNKACVRGALAAATKPTPVSIILNQCGVQERLFYSIIDSLVQQKQVPGTVTGKQSGSSIYVPTIYSKSQNDWVNNFYKQNGYLEYDALSRLGISDPRTFVGKHFPNEKLMLLKSCSVGSQLFDQVEAAVEEALATSSWLDVLPILPSVFEPEDAEVILIEVLKKTKNKSPNQNVHVFCTTVVVTDNFLQSLTIPFQTLIQKRAEEVVSSGVYLKVQAENKLHSNKNIPDQDEGISKVDKREERRKKATGGKGGGGTQGRETKTKSTKKKYQRGKMAAGDSDSDDDGPVASRKVGRAGGGKLELLTMTDIKLLLEAHESLQEDDIDEMITEIANHLHPSLNRTALAAAQAVFESTMASSAQSRRKTHSELQDKLNTMVTNVRLLEKGIKPFGKDTQQQLAKYLLKSLCTDITNEIFSYVAQENMIQYDQEKEMTIEVRVKILSDTRNEAKEQLSKLHKSLNSSSVEEFLGCVEGALGAGVCDMILRKQDKKKERPLLLAHRQSLLEQLAVSEDPALVLHLTTLIIFQAVTQTMLHASGRFVSNILMFLQPQMMPEYFNCLQRYHDLVLKLLTTGEDNELQAETISALQEGLPVIKEIATIFKKASSSEKSNSVQE